MSPAAIVVKVFFTTSSRPAFAELYQVQRRAKLTGSSCAWSMNFRSAVRAFSRSGAGIRSAFLRTDFSNVGASMLSSTRTAASSDLVQRRLEAAASFTAAIGSSTANAATSLCRR